MKKLQSLTLALLIFISLASFADENDENPDAVATEYPSREGRATPSVNTGGPPQDNNPTPTYDGGGSSSVGAYSDLFQTAHQDPKQKNDGADEVNPEFPTTTTTTTTTGTSIGVDDAPAEFPIRGGGTPTAADWDTGGGRDSGSADSVLFKTAFKFPGSYIILRELIAVDTFNLKDAHFENGEMIIGGFAVGAALRFLVVQVGSKLNPYTAALSLALAGMGMQTATADEQTQYYLDKPTELFNPNNNPAASLNNSQELQQRLSTIIKKVGTENCSNPNTEIFELAELCNTYREEIAAATFKNKLRAL